MLAAEPPNALHPTRTPTPATAKIIFGAALGLPAVDAQRAHEHLAHPEHRRQSSQDGHSEYDAHQRKCAYPSSLHSNARP